MQRREFLGVAAALAGAGAVTACQVRPAEMQAFSSGRITVQVSGSGPDVILVPGLTSSRRIWPAMMAAVPGYRYHLVQLAGFGGEPVAGAGEGPVAAPAAEEIARYIAESGLVRPALIGHSMGAFMSLMVAARHPELPGKVLAIDILPFAGLMFGPPGTTAQSVRPMADIILAQLQSATPEDRAARIQATLPLMVKDEAGHDLAWSDAMASDQGVAARAMHELIVTDLRDELPRITVPVTVLYVLAHNGIIGGALLESLFESGYAGLAHGKLVEIPDSRHFIMFDQPQRFAAEVRAFLAP